MLSEQTELVQTLREYQSAVEEWIAAIRTEERLASATESVAQVDRWERAHFKEEAARNKALSAKKSYESVLRQKFYQFKC